MREELHNTDYKRRYRGITPTHAGRICGQHYHAGRRWDHPRACGKNENKIKLSRMQTGSPPRMREELRDMVYTLLGQRITPAHAGRMHFEGP